MKEEEDHQRSSAPAKMNGTKNESSLLPPVDDDWKKVIEKFSSSSERENMMNINAFARRRRKHFAQKREQKRYTYSHRHLDSPGRLAADFHVEKDNWVRHIL